MQMNSENTSIYHKLLLVVGPDPSEKVLEKAFEFASYSSEERSEFLSLLVECKLSFTGERTGYITYSNVMIPFHSFFGIFALTIVLTWLLRFTEIQYPLISSFFSSIGIILICSLKFKGLRPVSVKQMWQESVFKVVSGQ